VRLPRLRYVLVSLAIVILLVVTLVPAVPYHLTVSNPGFPYRMQGYLACQAQFDKNNVINTSLPTFKSCIAQYLIPPINVTGYGSLSFSLLGIGLHPFPDTLIVGESEFYAILHMSDARIVAAEQVPQPDVVLNAPGITISNSSVSWGFLGTSNLTVTVTNTSGQTLDNPWVFVSVPGSSGNYTDGHGVTWIFTLDAPSTTLVYDPCLQNGRPQNLTSGASCIATIPSVISTPFGSSFRYSVEVQGRLGSHYSVTAQTYSYSISSQAANRLWVSTFIELVNGARNGSSLTETTTLDTFANMRFNTAVAQPDISDYGLQADETSFFGANGTSPAIVEVLLYPAVATANPYSYLNTIRTSAPGHWAALTDGNYTHFGYYVGTGPYEFVQQPCSVSEIPGAGVNITQFFENAGCNVSTQQSTWLVIILSS
jgi:hypothetical protein